MLLSEFDYALPPERIAQQPVEPRDSSRLLTINRESGQIVSDGTFGNILDWINPGDLLVVNETKVNARRLFATSPHGGKIELFLTHRIAPGLWQALARPGRKLHVGTVISLGDGLSAEILESIDDRGGRVIQFTSTNANDVDSEIDRVGLTPLPPYIASSRENDDKARSQYQTVYARNPGSSAAPTAGLHFTPGLLTKLAAKGVVVCKVTLHVGIGTFRPIVSERIEEHTMHEEEVEIPAEAASAIAASTGKIIAVGTTSLRALEASAIAPRQVRTGRFSTGIYITPGYVFKIVDSLITNFHMPRSTLLVLVSAFMGHDGLKAAYGYAMENGFRFLSFGDAMFIRQEAHK